MPPGVCVDSRAWQDPAGNDCDYYVKRAICGDGTVFISKEIWMGAAHNHPEMHCCACGRPVREYFSVDFFVKPGTYWNFDTCQRWSRKIYTQHFRNP